MANPKRTKVPQWIEGRGVAGPFVVRVLADALILEGDDPEPCFEPRTMKLLEEAQRLADAGNIEALTRIGDVYFRKSA